MPYAIFWSPSRQGSHRRDPQGPKHSPSGLAVNHRSLRTLLLKRGADSVEVDTEWWATPLAWAEKMNRGAVRSVLAKHAQHQSRVVAQCLPEGAVGRDGRSTPT